MGQGIGQNQKKALEFLKTAATLNHCEALYELGVAHVKGDYVPVDLAEAEHYLDRAIEGGHVAAKYELALNLLPMSDQPDKINKAMKLFHQVSQPLPPLPLPYASILYKDRALNCEECAVFICLCLSIIISA
jgi:TPR repeat protein